MVEVELKALGALAKLCGIQPRYRSMSGAYVSATPECLLAVLRALGVDIDSPASAPVVARRIIREGSGLVDPVVVCWDGAPRRVALEGAAASEAAVTLESGEIVPCPTNRRSVSVPALPAGYHTLEIRAGARTARALMIAAPSKCYSHDTRERQWGVVAPVHGLRTRTDDGAGDLRSLGMLASHVDGVGGSVVGTLPLLATDLAADPSPYRPLSRLFWNEFYARPTVRRGAHGARHHRDEFVNYAAVSDARMRAIRGMREHSTRGGRVTREAETYCLFRAARHRYGADWRRWPRELRLGHVTPEDIDRTTFDAYMQGQRMVNEQMSVLSADLRARGQMLYLDLPIGVDPNGFDVWRYPEQFVDGATVGAPPDVFFKLGQDWSIPLPHPLRARDSGYHLWIATLRHNMRNAGLIRVDHVMGLHRLYLIPAGAMPSEGVYVRQPAEPLYAILSLESHRNACEVVGENLGTVPAEVNAAMRRHGLISMYVGQFNLPDRETGAVAPRRDAMVSLNTHDMFPFLGFWRALDIKDQLARGLIAREEARVRSREREAAKRAIIRQLTTEGFLQRGQRGPRAVLRAWQCWLAASHAKYVMLSAEDLYLGSEPQNRPGTGPDEAPNWRRRIPLPLELGLGSASSGSMLRDVREIRKRGVGR